MLFSKLIKIKIWFQSILSLLFYSWVGVRETRHQTPDETLQTCERETRLQWPRYNSANIITRVSSTRHVTSVGCRLQTQPSHQNPSFFFRFSFLLIWNWSSSSVNFKSRSMGIFLNIPALLSGEKLSHSIKNIHKTCLECNIPLFFHFPFSSLHWKSSWDPSNSGSAAGTKLPFCPSPCSGNVSSACSQGVKLCNYFTW